MTRFARLMISMAAAAFLAACGGGGGGTVEEEGGGGGAQVSATLTGTLFAPDGTTPIGNALVYVEGSSQASASAADRKFAAAVPDPSQCGVPPTASWAYTCTGADGSFTLDGQWPTSAVLKAKKGAFSLTQTVTSTSGGTVALGSVALPATGVQMAVVKGSYDSVEDVLAKLGYGEVESGQLKPGTEKFALLDNDTSLYATDTGTGKANIFKYSIVFLNCGTDEMSVTDPARLQILRDYVNGGGRLYASDLAYDFVEQAFPGQVDFHGSVGRSAASAETPDDAEVGDSDIESQATLDPVLRDWLATVQCASGACLGADNTAKVDGFLSGWAVMEGPHAGADVRVWVKGPVTYSGQTTPVEKPLTVSFEVGSGRVTYTSYHNESFLASEAGFSPVERIMQFLVFEL